MTFRELSELTGEPLRFVQIELTEEDAKILRQIPGYENFDPRKEVLLMIKAVYGLKDAPRAWRLEWSAAAVGRARALLHSQNLRLVEDVQIPVGAHRIGEGALCRAS